MNKQGRPRVPTKHQQRPRQVSLDDMTVAKARLLGHGNVSEGIRRALHVDAVTLDRSTAQGILDALGKEPGNEALAKRLHAAMFPFLYRMD